MSYTPRTEATSDEIAQWRQQRATVGDRVIALNENGICYSCRELSDGDVFDHQYLLIDESDIRVALVADPRVPGHTVVVWKEHAHDFTELDDAATARIFTVCRDVARALRTALAGVERVYQVTMCDGKINHLHIQLIPRYAGTPIGSKRFLDARGPLLDGDQVASAITAAYDAQASR